MVGPISLATYLWFLKAGSELGPWSYPKETHNDHFLFPSHRPFSFHRSYRKSYPCVYQRCAPRLLPIPSIWKYPKNTKKPDLVTPVSPDHSFIINRHTWFNSSPSRLMENMCDCFPRHLIISAMIGRHPLSPHPQINVTLMRDGGWFSSLIIAMHHVLNGIAHRTLLPPNAKLWCD